ncbi:X-ray repair cross complementing 2 [Osmia lignaria lignaria]|uniref:X-ray repair cross complementing 2 n=1 Tax=Osmia lignaria lignaria TaxID=1437193 RepID=UPI001478B7E0|nr:DNA repair protein XRCC2 [Osmia lignaria]
MRSQIESGAELLTRLNNKSSLCELEDTLFFEGIRSTDVIEITGEQSTGKTHLLSRILAKCILPNYFQIEGCNASAILINADHHFQVSKLSETMSNIIDSTGEKNVDKTTVIQNSLHNLQIINCYNSEQFSLTLHTLEDTFLNNPGTALVAIDSITAYYWQDREMNAMTMDSYVKKLLKPVRVPATRFNIVTIYTRPCENMRYTEKKFATNMSGNNIAYRIHLCKTPNPQKFMCTLETVQTIKRIYYSILSYGIKWKMDNTE